MTALTALEGVAAPLPLANVDTDVIIRIEKLARVPREALGHWAFEPLRLREDGSENPGFVLNQPGWRGAPLLVTGPNFGCGSSREQAVWALQGLGIRCVIAPSFGDIFRSNCFQNGVLPLQLPADEAQWLLEQLEQRRQCGEAVMLRLDLQARSLQWPGVRQWGFEIEERRRQALLQGLDEIGMTRLLLPQIQQWQARDRLERPWVWQTAG